MYGGWGDLSGEGVRGGRSVFSALSFLALVFISQCLAYPSFSFMLPICCSVLLLALFFFRLFIISPLRHNRCLHPHLYTRLCFCVSARRPHISSILLHPSPSLSHFPSVTFSCCFVAVCSIPSRLFPSHSLFCRLDRTSMLFMFFFLFSSRSSPASFCPQRHFWRRMQLQPKAPAHRPPHIMAAFDALRPQAVDLLAGQV